MGNRDQALDHLALANTVRLQRAEDKRLIKAGQLDVVDVLRDAPRHWASAKLVDLLVQVPFVGMVKARRWCRTLALNPHRQIGQLTERERTVMAQMVATWSAQQRCFNAEPILV
jgi:hypothetical protein